MDEEDRKWEEERAKALEDRQLQKINRCIVRLHRIREELGCEVEVALEVLRYTLGEGDKTSW